MPGITCRFAIYPMLHQDLGEDSRDRFIEVEFHEAGSGWRTLRFGFQVRIQGLMLGDFPIDPFPIIVIVGKCIVNAG